MLDLATDTAGPGPCAKAQEAAAAQAANVRRHAVNVMDDVQRNGLAPPWDAIPHLVAATTDSSRCGASLGLPCQCVLVHQACQSCLTICWTQVFLHVSARLLWPGFSLGDEWPPPPHWHAQVACQATELPDCHCFTSMFVACGLQPISSELQGCCVLAGCSDVAARALEVLGRINEKQPDMLLRLVGSGLNVAVAFNLRLQQSAADGALPLPSSILGEPSLVIAFLLNCFL